MLFWCISFSYAFLQGSSQQTILHKGFGDCFAPDALSDSTWAWTQKPRVYKTAAWTTELPQPQFTVKLTKVSKSSVLWYVWVYTWCDVELIADGEAPHTSSDTRRKPLPPQFSDSSCTLPTCTHTMRCRNTPIYMNKKVNGRTWCPS